MTQLPAVLVNAIKEQKAVLFLGAGASFDAQHPNGTKIPSANELRDMICDKFCGGQLKHKPLIEIATLAASDAGLSNFQLYIREIFEPFLPAEHHLLIPQFKWHTIISTNYDLLIERAYTSTAAPQQRLVVRVKDSDQFDTRLNATSSPVGYFKLHGCIDYYTDETIPLILSSEQYTTYSDNRAKLHSRFHELGIQYPVIFAGYSLQDAHIQKFVFDDIGAAKTRPMVT